MNKLKRMLTGITILTALAGCSTVDNRPIVTYRELQENPGCYNLFEYRLPDKEASDIRGSPTPPLPLSKRILAKPVLYH